jgi:hypothetical protein
VPQPGGQIMVVAVVKLQVKTDKVRSDWRVSQSITKYCKVTRYTVFAMVPGTGKTVKVNAAGPYTDIFLGLSMADVKRMMKTYNQTSAPLFHRWLDRKLGEVEA